ncbi:hypothetical protein D3C85_1464120 [compost metagenome]
MVDAMSPEPMPRMYQRGRWCPANSGAMALGTFCRALPALKPPPLSAICLALTTEMAEGTSCTDSSRFCAVTVMMGRAAGVGSAAKLGSVGKAAAMASNRGKRAKGAVMNVDVPRGGRDEGLRNGCARWVVG